MGGGVKDLFFINTTSTQILYVKVCITDYLQTLLPHTPRALFFSSFSLQRTCEHQAHAPERTQGDRRSRAPRPNPNPSFAHATASVRDHVCLRTRF